MWRALLCGDDSSHSQSQSGKRLLLASRGHPVRTVTYQGSCIDPTHLSNTLDPTPGVPFPITGVTIRLLIKDKYKQFIKMNLSYATCDLDLCLLFAHNLQIFLWALQVPSLAKFQCFFFFLQMER